MSGSSGGQAKQRYRRRIKGKPWGSQCFQFVFNAAVKTTMEVNFREVARTMRFSISNENSFNDNAYQPTLLLFTA